MSAQDTEGNRTPGLAIRLGDAAAVLDGRAGLRFAINWLDRPATGFVIRHQGQLHGYVNQCAHVAMELDWRPGDFFDNDLTLLICATHGALYEPASGRCAGGPCTGRGGLRRLAIEELDGGIWWTPDHSATAPS